MMEKLLAVSGDTLTATVLLQVQPEYNVDGRVSQPCPSPSATGLSTPSARVTKRCLWARRQAARGKQPG